MRLCGGVLAFILACAVPVLSAEPAEWGKPVNGLRMALALVNAGYGAPQVVEITIENIGDRTSVVQIGSMSDTRGLTLQAGSDAGAEWVDYTLGGQGVGLSSPIPFLVPLLPGSRYQIRRQTGDYWMPTSRVSLGRFLLGPGPHWVRADLRAGGKPDSPFPTPVVQPPPPKGCVDEDKLWEGTLSSNTLRFPARRQK